MQKGFIGLDGFIWWQGVVEDRNDPIMLGRVRVRIFGFHTEDTTLMPTENLPWALVGMPIDHGNNPVGLREGDWVVGFFKDGIAQQEPIVMFVIPGIPTQSAVPGVGFSDQTSIDRIVSGETPRPPEFGNEVNFAASMVVGIQDASKNTLNNFFSEIRPKLSLEERKSLDGLTSQLPKFDSKSTLNLTQSILQNPANIQNIIKNFGSNGLIDTLGVGVARRLSQSNAKLISDGLSSVSRLVAKYPELQVSFRNRLQSEIDQKLSSFVQNNIPSSVRKGLSVLGPSNPINIIISNLSNGGTFQVSQLFDGNINFNVSGVINSLLPINDPSKLIEKLGRDVAGKISEFLGLDFGENDQEWVPLEFENENQTKNPFANPNALPIQGTSVGVLLKDYKANSFPYDVNKDGIYNQVDANLLISANRKSGVADTGGSIKSNAPVYAPSRYPLEPFLNEPITSRLARNDKIQDTIVSKKQSSILTFAEASYEPIKRLKLTSPTVSFSRTSPPEAKGSLTDQSPLEGETFEEPKSPYNAKYPFNHVYASESGHFIEIDDTPKAERLHWYHRSGTFREIHPDGILVDKSVKDSYDISAGNMYKGSSKNLILNSVESTKIKSDSDLIVESSSTSVTTGQFSIKSGSTFQDVEGGHAQRISDNKQVEVNGDYSIKTTGNFTLDADSITLRATSHVAIDALVSHISIRTPAGVIVLEGQTIGNNTPSFNVVGAANLLPTFFPLYTPNPQAPYIPELEDTKDDVVDSPFKPGFVLKFSNGGTDPYNERYLYKPTSDSDGKPVVLAPPGNGRIVVYEALPTGELEDVDIQYRYSMNQVTTWRVKRPKHRRGNVIEYPRFAGEANGNRAHYRFSKYAKDYPKQFIIADDTVEFLVLDCKIRHD